MGNKGRVIMGGGVKSPRIHAMHPNVRAIAAYQTTVSVIGMCEITKLSPVGGNRSSGGRPPNHATLPIENENRTSVNKTIRKTARFTGADVAVKKSRTNFGARSQKR